MCFLWSAMPEPGHAGSPSSAALVLERARRVDDGLAHWAEPRVRVARNADKPDSRGRRHRVGDGNDAFVPAEMHGISATGESRPLALSTRKSKDEVGFIGNGIGTHSLRSRPRRPRPLSATVTSAGRPPRRGGLCLRERVMRERSASAVSQPRAERRPDPDATEGGSVVRDKGRRPDANQDKKNPSRPKGSGAERRDLWPRATRGWLPG